MNIKKVVKIICLVIVLIVLALAIFYFVKSGKLEKKDETSQLKLRVSQEIKFLDDYIFSIANSVNNINLENYILKSETISGQSTSENSGQQNSKTSGEGQNEQGKESEEDGNQSSNSQGGGSSSQSNESKTKANSYIIQPSDILVNERDTDWENIKISVERLYPTWSTIAMDLYKLNVDNKKIQEFGKNLDLLTISAKEQNKINTLQNISEMYDYLSLFGNDTFENNSEISILRTKASILKAYAVIEEEKWEDIKTYISQAENEYTNIMSQSNKKNEYNINRAYILLKQFQSSIESHNKDILYIKYKNLLDELNIVSV